MSWLASHLCKLASHFVYATWLTGLESEVNLALHGHRDDSGSGRPAGRVGSGQKSWPTWTRGSAVGQSMQYFFNFMIFDLWLLGYLRPFCIIKSIKFPIYVYVDCWCLIQLSQTLQLSLYKRMQALTEFMHTSFEVTGVRMNIVRKRASSFIGDISHCWAYCAHVGA